MTRDLVEYAQHPNDTGVYKTSNNAPSVLLPMVESRLF